MDGVIGTKWIVEFERGKEESRLEENTIGTGDENCSYHIAHSRRTFRNIQSRFSRVKPTLARSIGCDAIVHTSPATVPR